MPDKAAVALATTLVALGSVIAVPPASAAAVPGTKLWGPSQVVVSSVWNSNHFRANGSHQRIYGYIRCRAAGKQIKLQIFSVNETRFLGSSGQKPCDGTVYHASTNAAYISGEFVWFQLSVPRGQGATTVTVSAYKV